MEYKSARAAFESVQEEAVRELNRMEVSGIMDVSIIDRVMAASDMASEVLHRMRHAA